MGYVSICIGIHSFSHGLGMYQISALLRTRRRVYSHTLTIHLPLRVCAAQRGRDFGTGYTCQRRFLERGQSGTGYNISNARKLQFCKQPFDIIQGQIAFKNTVQCVNKQTVVLLLHPVF